MNYLLDSRGHRRDDVVAEGLRRKPLSLQNAIIGTLTASILTVALVPMTALAQDSKVTGAMELLKSKASELGPPKIEGTDTVAGKEVPAIYFGSTKMNNNFTLVDDVVKEADRTATIFVKSGDGYIRVATNVKRTTGRELSGPYWTQKEKRSSPSRKVKPSLARSIFLGKPYVTGYDPIRDSRCEQDRTGGLLDASQIERLPGRWPAGQQPG